MTLVSDDGRVPLLVGPALPAGCLRALARWSFDTLGLHRLFLLHSTANLASCRVAAKTAFGVEGTLRNSLLHADGWHDAHLHARLRTDVDGPPKREQTHVRPSMPKSGVPMTEEIHA